MVAVKYFVCCRVGLDYLDEAADGSIYAHTKYEGHSRYAPAYHECSCSRSVGNLHASWRTSLLGPTVCTRACNILKPLAGSFHERMDVRRGPGEVNGTPEWTLPHGRSRCRNVPNTNLVLLARHSTHDSQTGSSKHRRHHTTRRIALVLGIPT